ncbi:DUF1415 domain-containing protein [Aliikangiella sp. G2MR2-5]|uniref:DUF1415 domain-containing protein n=1 Tax=Aliikangiella sp. G2MR2-5 TaxID=2788943 RepID=UPI001AEF0916|nr:DUF1415 domain-containing protein [Aliikangiella sp. G2MR2-5]
MVFDQELMNQKIISSVKFWILNTIIGFNFCPFAKREFDRDSIHYEVVNEILPEEQLHSLVHEFTRLDKCPAIETSIIIFPQGLESFFDYLDFVELANELLAEQNYEGIYQLASFHPDYCFEDVTQEDVSNFTNRSPYPMIHIIREASLEKVLEKYPSPETIPERNIELARSKGIQIFKDILQKSRDQ